MVNFFCTDCNKHTKVIFDHTSSDTLCSECGVVLESHSINESSKLLTFTNSSSLNTDPKSSPRLHKKSHHLNSAFNIISTMANRLSLVSTIKDRAQEIYMKLRSHSSSEKSLNKHYSCRGKNLDTILAACLFVACQQENLPRTLKEICSVISNGTTAKKHISRAKSFITKHLRDIEVENNKNCESNTNSNSIISCNSKVMRAADFVKRFCSNVGIMDNCAMKAAYEAAQKSEDEIDLRRSPLSLAATVVYIVSQLRVVTDKQVGFKDIAVATGVGEWTIRSCYKDILPYIQKIIPSWFVSGDDFKILYSTL